MRARTFLHVMSLEARTRMSYRADFWINAIIGFASEFALVWFLWWAMFRESGRDTIGGYTFDGMILYYVAAILFGKFVRGREFETGISADIYEGGLNRYLVLPAPYLPFKYAQHLGTLAPILVQFVLFGAVCFLLLDIPPGLSPGIGTSLMALLTIVVANVLHYLLSYPIQAVAFWADNVWSLDVAKRFVAGLLGGYMVPLTVFPDAFRPVLELLPFRFFFSFPARVFLGQVGPWEWAAGMVLALGWCGVFALIGRAVWRRGDLQYTGVGI